MWDLTICFFGNVVGPDFVALVDSGPENHKIVLSFIGNLYNWESFSLKTSKDSVTKVATRSKGRHGRDDLIGFGHVFYCF